MEQVRGVAHAVAVQHEALDVAAVQRGRHGLHRSARVVDMSATTFPGAISPTGSSGQPGAVQDMRSVG